MKNGDIKVSGLTKTFRIYDRPTDRLKELFNFLGRKRYYTEFSALKNVSFEIPSGTFLGVVGKNGAGKSTLLKILSGELSPTSGSVSIGGRVALLQLGVGFDQELPGRENLRYSCRILGFSDEEITTIEKKVIDFAELGEFIDHPVKTYSSGMYSRLAFAVGVHVDPDVLIADEVLAVGDMQFSQKCIRKMREFKERGKTVVLVTHDTNTVSAFCDHAIWIKEGELFRQGRAFDIAEEFRNYMLYGKLPGEGAVEPTGKAPKESLPLTEHWEDLRSTKDLISNGSAQLEAVTLLNEAGQRLMSSHGNESVRVLMRVKAMRDIKELYCGFLVNDAHGLPAVQLNNEFCFRDLGCLSAGQTTIISFAFKLPNLKNGQYSFDFAVFDKGMDYELLTRVHSCLILATNRNDQFAKCSSHVIIEDGRVEIIEANQI